jgi:tRNA pseudouridine38-40 synthase
VQEVLENALSTILRTPIEITGCGRTDTGVHASQYFIHFDFENSFPEGFLNRLNKFLPKDIAVFRIFEVTTEANARYDAFFRRYAYYVSSRKEPFDFDTTYHLPFFEDLDLDKLQMTAELLAEYEDFFPFCKTHTDVKSMKCQIYSCFWQWNPDTNQLIFHVAANRFLRGMVRLMVGACLNVALGKQSLEDVKQALDNQERLAKSWSVPAEGLFLEEIRYPYVEREG